MQRVSAVLYLEHVWQNEPVQASDNWAETWSSFVTNTRQWIEPVGKARFIETGLFRSHDRAAAVSSSAQTPVTPSSACQSPTFTHDNMSEQASIGGTRQEPHRVPSLLTDSDNDNDDDTDTAAAYAGPPTPPPKDDPAVVEHRRSNPTFPTPPPHLEMPQRREQVLGRKFGFLRTSSEAYQSGNQPSAVAVPGVRRQIVRREPSRLTLKRRNITNKLKRAFSTNILNKQA